MENVERTENMEDSHIRIPNHPGDILKENLQVLGMSQAVLAECMRVNRYRVNDLILGRRSMSAEMALRLGKVFNMSPEFWCNLQIAYDLAIAKTKHEKDILDIVPL